MLHQEEEGEEEDIVHTVRRPEIHSCLEAEDRIDLAEEGIVDLVEEHNRIDLAGSLADRMKVEDTVQEAVVDNPPGEIL